MKIIKELEVCYKNKIEYLKTQATLLKAVYEAGGNVRKAARILEWDYHTVRATFEFQLDCCPAVKRRRLSQKESAYVLWQRATAAMVGYENWKEIEDEFRSE